ncbi:hypothetical protein KMW28_08700 [Flammeovirga yaeyamensis]|uniref:Chemotaxis methyl-accepting receptor HlyB-like 4HB MCP domain-containing protein n=1 Tax=Flammeovirga yaeyamensis TaxID=367791 RepID=A0AAX1N807_9BACT|nr:MULTISPECIES: hypothetical protein [Flammeovirga]ANQ48876.1 hypothetical protein MY04_1500 [Flammeovirga sp. MY04]MBB3698959.1 hypothetical protein [Flammeovirga yaeyamensis]NMF36393.1 hypothetical protein [Flammeovirga yaeyamensis]QWG03646.1 hypothetical protein KMW28_08700 [Flammeovirga yaeyamensis]
MKKSTVSYKWRKIVKWFYGYFVACFVIAVSNFSAFRQIEDQDVIVEKVIDLRQMTMSMTLAAQEFLSYEAHYEEFHRSRQATPIMTEYHKVDKKLEAYVGDIMESNDSWKMAYEDDLKLFSDLLAKHRKTFSKIVTQLKYRGSQTSGMIGDLQKRTKSLQEDPYVNNVLLEEMRLLEKSYLLSADTADFYKIRELNHRLQREVKGIEMPNGRKHNILNHLRRYNSILLRIVQVDDRIGFRGDVGLTLTLQNNTEAIIKLSDEMYKKAQYNKDWWMSTSRWIAVIFGTLSVCVLLVLSLSTNELINKIR